MYAYDVHANIFLIIIFHLQFDLPNPLTSFQLIKLLILSGTI